jgi:hypothetical protein
LFPIQTQKEIQMETQDQHAARIIAASNVALYLSALDVLSERERYQYNLAYGYCLGALRQLDSTQGSV